MRLGAHISAAGGLYKAFERAANIDCETMLVFTKSNRMWKAKPLTEEDISSYGEHARNYAHVAPVAVHASYLINIASSDEALWEKSRDGLRVELDRAEALGIPLLTFHPGASVTATAEVGLANISRAVREIMSETEGYQVRLCFETMAGTGTTLGSRFEELAFLLEDSSDGGRNSGRLGVCFDTCHVFAAGYDIRSPESYEDTMKQFDETIGLQNIACFHFNDSKHDLGSHRDRHEHIGRGFIGVDGFANILNDPRWKDYPAHLETPKIETVDDGTETEMDPVNLATLRSLVKSA